MRFEKLVMENFSSFYRKHQIEFNTTIEKPVTIIVGGSGKGKTSIFDAINWGLYGEQYEPVLKKESEKDITDYINETALQEATDKGSGVEMACSLFFEHDGKHYRIQQAIFAKKNNDRITITDRTSTLYEITPTGNHSPISHIDLFLNEILPSNVRDYFLFNSDRINKLSLPGSSQEIRDGIYRVVDLELLQNGIAHLLEVAKKFRKNVKDSTEGEAFEIEERYSQAHDDLEALKNKLEDLSKERRALDDRINIIENKLLDLKKTHELQQINNALKEKYRSLEKELKETILNLRSQAGIAVFCFALDDIENLEKVLEEKKEKREIPSAISVNLLQDILDIGKCLCGTEFKEGDNIYHELKNRLDEEAKKEGKGNILLDLYFDLKNTKSIITESIETLEKLESKRNKIEQEIKEIDRQIADTQLKLRNMPDEDIPKLVQANSKCNSELTEIKLNIQDIQRKIKDKEEEIRILQAKRNEFEIKQVKVRKYKLRELLAQRAADELGRIFDKFAEESRMEIEALTREEFYKFIPTVKALSVGIDPEFHYDVRDQNGNPALQQLSNGQKQALSLAYITSISRVSEKNPPLVIDMPFGKLDKEVQDNIAIRLPDLSSQVILLVLPGTEWNEHIQSILRPKTSHIYYLDFDEQNRQTTIRKE